jgi:hypothetical protein
MKCMLFLFKNKMNKGCFYPPGYLKIQGSCVSSGDISLSSSCSIYLKTFLKIITVISNQGAIANTIQLMTIVKINLHLFVFCLLVLNTTHAKIYFLKPGHFN